MTDKEIDYALVQGKRDISSAWDEAVDIVRELQDKVEELEDALKESQEENEDLKSQIKDLT